MNKNKFRRKSQILAFSNIFAFGIQGIFALFMLRFFSPNEIGEFSVISQIAAFWMAIALAQTPWRILANKGSPIYHTTIDAWLGSLYRAILLYPVIFIAFYYCELGLWPSILWASLITFFQLTWLITQSYILQSGSDIQQALVRISPPLSALLLSAFGAYFGHEFGWHGPILITAAIIGYAIGAIGFIKVFTDHKHQKENQSIDNISNPEADNRSTILRMLHSFTDAALLTLIATTWHRLYGPTETGLMMVILRVLSFLPILIWSAWTQILITRPTKNTIVKILNFNINPWIIGAISTVCICLIGVACTFAINEQFLNSSWSGILEYLIPISIWQATTCFSAALSHRPFQTQKSIFYSWACISLNIIQITALISPLIFDSKIGKIHHIYFFCATASFAAIALTVWLSMLETSESNISKVSE